jgi:hypothetical protein
MRTNTGTAKQTEGRPHLALWLVIIVIQFPDGENRHGSRNLGSFAVRRPDATAIPVNVYWTNMNVKCLILTSVVPSSVAVLLS